MTVVVAVQSRWISNSIGESVMLLIAVTVVSRVAEERLPWISNAPSGSGRAADTAISGVLVQMLSWDMFTNNISVTSRVPAL